MGSSFAGAGFTQGLSRGISQGMEQARRNKASARQQEQYEQQKEMLAAQKKKLDTYQKALEQLAVDNPALHQRLILGLGEKKPKDAIYEQLLKLLGKAGQASGQAGAGPPTTGAEGTGGLVEQLASAQNPIVRAVAQKEFGLPMAKETTHRRVAGESGPETQVWENDPLTGRRILKQSLPEHQEAPGRNQFVPLEVARDSGISPTTTMEEARQMPGLILKTEEEKRQAAIVAPEKLKLYTDPQGDPPRGIWKQGAFEQAIQNGVYFLKADQSAGEAQKKIAMAVPMSIDALDRVESVLFPEGGEFRADLLRNSAFVPQNPDSFKWKVSNWAGFFPESGPLVEDMLVALEPIQRLMSGGAIKTEEGARFLANYLPGPHDRKRPEVVRRKIAMLREVYAELEKINDPFSKSGSAKVSAIIRRANVAAGSRDTTTPSRAVLETAHRYFLENPDGRLERNGQVLTRDIVNEMLERE